MDSCLNEMERDMRIFFFFNILIVSVIVLQFIETKNSHELHYLQ